MSKASDSIQRGLEEAVDYAKGEADPRLFRITAADAKAMKGKTDWKRLRALTDEDIKRAVADDPDESLADADFWKNAKLVLPEAKEKISLRLDRDVLDFFRRSGRRYQTRINAVLRAFMEQEGTSRR